MEAEQGLQGLQGFFFAAQGFLAAHGLQDLAAQGLHALAAQGFLAAHGLQAAFAAHGFFAAQGLQPAAYAPGAVTALAMTVTAAAVSSSLNIEYLLADFD